MIQAKALCDYAMAAVGGGYCYGSSGEVCSPQKRQEWAQWNPSQRENLLGLCAKWDGKKVWDCSGLFRGAWRALSKYRSGGATTIFTTWCVQKGVIETMPWEAGIAVFRGDDRVKQHIGLYVGNGMVVDARSSSKGVVLGPIDAYKWTHWGRLDEVIPEGEGSGAPQGTTQGTGTVRTQTGGGVSLWSSNAKTQALVRIPDGASVDILGPADAAGFAMARYAGQTGVIDMRYIVQTAAQMPKDETDNTAEQLARSLSLLEEQVQGCVQALEAQKAALRAWMEGQP